jgi:ABC-type transport system involved in multi-copper enzyme maturation permease subunit
VNMSVRRIGAVVRKELRDDRRNRTILVAVAIFPLIFLIQPLVVIFLEPGLSAETLSQRHLLLYMLAIPALTPSVLAAYSVAGERQQGSLEPMLSTPIRREEFLLGKALAALLPAVVIAYLVFAFFIVCVLLFAQPAVAHALLRGQDIVAQLLLTPLLAGFSIWIGIAISTRSSDARVAQQLSLVASLPLVLLTSLIAFDVIHATNGLMVAVGAVLLVADVQGWRIVSPMFNREHLITGSKG